MQVAIGPNIDLHPGMHGALMAAPPCGVAYRTEAPYHLFLWEGEAGPPAERPHLAELLAWNTEADIVHSVRWPVLGHPAWVVEADDLLYPVVLGRYLLAAAAQAPGAFDAAEARLRLRRVVNMTAALSHESCRAVLLNTRYEKDRAARELVRLWPGKEADTVVDKMHVLYPAVGTLPATGLEEKWGSHHHHLKVVYCGRSFTHKGGDVAVRVMTEAMRQCANVRCVFVGPLPAEEKEGLRRWEDRFIHHAKLNPPALRAVLEQCHVLLHPSPSDTLGMILVQAIAAGMVVVARSGARLPHMGELVEDGVTGLLAADDGEQDSEQGLLRRIVALAGRPQWARELAFASVRRAVDGPVSVAARDRTLVQAYRPAGANADVLTTASLPDGRRATLTLSSGSGVAAGDAECAARHGLGTRVDGELGI